MAIVKCNHDDTKRRRKTRRRDRGDGRDARGIDEEEFEVGWGFVYCREDMGGLSGW
jgi:hypothetical protein